MAEERGGVLRMWVLSNLCDDSPHCWQLLFHTMTVNFSGINCSLHQVPYIFCLFLQVPQFLDKLCLQEFMYQKWGSNWWVHFIIKSNDNVLSKKILLDYPSNQPPQAEVELWLRWCLVRFLQRKHKRNGNRILTLFGSQTVLEIEIWSDYHRRKFGDGSSSNTVDYLRRAGRFWLLVFHARDDAGFK